MGSCIKKPPTPGDKPEPTTKTPDPAKNFKLLLLGAGESGKSTIFSQMKIIHKGGFTDEEKLSMKRVVMDNLLQYMVSLINGAKKVSVELDSDDHRSMADKILEVESSLEEASNIEELLPTVIEEIKALWKDAGIRKAFEQRNKFQIFDQAQYFLDKPDRFSAPDFLPNEEDIIKCRGKTLGVVEMHFEVDNNSFTIVDVGGQRNERKKWIHCFEGVAAVIFVTSLSEYDQTLFEDGTTNRMIESLKLFDEVCNSRWFKDSHIILFLNKTDLFREKIKKFDPKDYCFPDYDGGLDYEKALEYIEQQFIKKNSINRKIYIQKTCATDTGNIRFVFNVIRDIVFHKTINEIFPSMGS